MRILVAGVGNVLRGDDAFGVEVLRALQCQDLVASASLPRETSTGSRCQVEFFESGIAGISLVQRLMDGFDALIIIDALERGGTPGQVYVLEPDLDSLRNANATGETIDLHQADPEGVVRLAAALRVLPRYAWIIGCQAVGCDELEAPLSQPVAQAVPVVVEHVQRIVRNLTSDSAVHATRRN